MHERSMHRLLVFLASLGLAASILSLQAQDDSHRGRKYKSPPPSARIEITVLRDTSGKPIQDAHVIFHPIEGDKDKGYMELKTNDDGKVVIDVLPIGDTVRMQVIAKGFQTYGQDYKVDKPELLMEVRMKRPGAQYSIYNNPPSDSGNGTSPGKPDNPSHNAAPPDSGSKPDAQPH